MIPGSGTKTTALLNGEIVRFDAQSTGDLFEAKKYYAGHFKYIGSTETVYYNGEKDNDGKMHHIFIRK